jgi:hypothetical protein
MLLWPKSVILRDAKCRYVNVFIKIVAMISIIMVSVAILCVMLNVIILSDITVVNILMLLWCV